jgi:hypothetical protein
MNFAQSEMGGETTGSGILILSNRSVSKVELIPKLKAMKTPSQENPS